MSNTKLSIFLSFAFATFAIGAIVLLGITISKIDLNELSQINNVENQILGETASNSENVKVIEVVDGDTVKVSIDGSKETVRLIGIDTPETVHPQKPVECFGKEASDKLKELLTEKIVKLENDPTQDNMDKYGRLLRYIYLEDGTSINLQMIKQGYAFEYTYKVPYQYQSEFKKAEAEARASGLGLWGNECEYDL